MCLLFLIPENSILSGNKIMKNIEEFFSSIIEIHYFYSLKLLELPSMVSLLYLKNFPAPDKEII
jgi:hypothetical protein